MKKYNKVLLCLFMVFVCAAALCFSASASVYEKSSDALLLLDETSDSPTVSGDYSYYPMNAVDPYNIAICGYSGKDAVVKIPAKIDGKTVKAICDAAFANNENIKEVAIPGSVERIGAGAFYECTALKKVTFSNGVKSIESAAFACNPALKSAALPDSLEKIGEFAFENCKNLSSVRLGKNIKYLGRNIFNGTKLYKNKSNWKNNALYIGQYLICADSKKASGKISVKNGTIAVADSSFEKSAITGAVIPDSVKYIGENAFLGADKCKTVSIGKNVEFIGANAFKGTALYNDKKNWDKDVLYIGKYLIEMKRVSKAEKVTVKDGTRLIASNAFERDLNGKRKTNVLTCVVLPKSIKYINDRAFLCCIKLSKINLPEGLKAIGDFAFLRCESLRKISLPKSLKKLGEGAFQQCIGIEKFSVNKDNAYLSASKGVLFNKKQTALLYYPAANAAASYKLPKTVTRIGCLAFYNAKNLQNVTLGNNLRRIELLAFYNCTGLKQLIVPNGVKTIGYRAIGCNASAKTYTIYGAKGSAAEKYCKLSFTSGDGSTVYSDVPFKALCEKHSYKAVPAIAATYTAGGRTAYKHCTKCGVNVGLVKTAKLQLDKIDAVKVKKTAKAAKLSWNKAKDSDGCRVYRYDAKKDRYVKVAEISASSYTFKNLKSGAAYKFAVKPFVKADGKIILASQATYVTVKM